MEKLKTPVVALDGWAAVVFVLIAAAGTFGAVSHLGLPLTPDLVAAIFGGVMAVFALVRRSYEKWKAEETVTLADATTALAEMTTVIETMRERYAELRDAPNDYVHRYELAVDASGAFCPSGASRPSGVTTPTRVDPDSTPRDGLPTDDAEEILR